MINVAMKAARSAPRSDPAKNHDFLSSAKPRKLRKKQVLCHEIHKHTEPR
jgi:hypothetical protein